MKYGSKDEFNIDRLVRVVYSFDWMGLLNRFIIRKLMMTYGWVSLSLSNRIMLKLKYVIPMKDGMMIMRDGRMMREKLVIVSLCKGVLM